MISLWRLFSNPKQSVMPLARELENRRTYISRLFDYSEKTRDLGVQWARAGQWSGEPKSPALNQLVQNVCVGIRRFHGYVGLTFLLLLQYEHDQN